jgi:hypothetical protein
MEAKGKRATKRTTKRASKVSAPVEITVEQATDRLRHDYMDEIRALATNVIREAKQYNRDESDVLHEMIDGHHDVIYTCEAQRVLWLSDNADAAADEGMECVKDGQPDWSALAYFAMRADVQRLLDNSYFRADFEGDDK